jgi:predicted nucleotidyltransferase
MTKLIVKLKSQPLVKLYKTHGIKYSGLFGSRARGESQKDSDVDLVTKKGLNKYVAPYYETT